MISLPGVWKATWEYSCRLLGLFFSCWDICCDRWMGVDLRHDTPKKKKKKKKKKVS